jgi:predicted amidohydrolase YtcJ
MDAHTHLAAGAVDLLDLDLRGTRSGEELGGRVAAAASAAAPGAWVRGWGWDGTSLPAHLANERLVFLARRDGHAAWVSLPARAALGLPADTAVIAEEVFDAARDRLPARTTADRVAALRPRVAELAAGGVAAVDDMVESWAPEIYARLRDAGELPLAVGMWLPEAISISDAEALRREFPEDDRGLSVLGAKIFLDGTLSARTAALSSPYADDPGNSGELRLSERELAARVARWASRGWRVAVHAIGDRAVSVALDALERAPRPSAGSHRIEHAQVVRLVDLARFAEGRIVASVQPGHWRDDKPWLARRLGERPQVVSHPLRSLARAGATLVFGSDWPVSDWEPAAILASAGDPDRGEEAMDAAEAAAWYTFDRR